MDFAVEFDNSGSYLAVAGSDIRWEYSVVTGGYVSYWRTAVSGCHGFSFSPVGVEWLDDVLYIIKHKNNSILSGGVIG